MSIEIAILVSIIALLANAFFVGAEFAIISARRSSIELLALEGSRSAKITLSAMERVSMMLAGAQLGITLCTLIFGAVGEPIVAHALEEPLHNLGVSDALLHPIALIIALTLMVYMHVVIGEMIPKNIALAGPNKAALLLAPPLVLIVRLSRPIVLGLNAVANACLRILGVQPNDEVVSSFSRDEVAGFVKESHREGYLSEDEEQLLSGALQFDAENIRRLVLPLDSIVTVSDSATVHDIEALTAKAGFSRYPVLNKAQKIMGYIHIKDLLHITDDQAAAPVNKRLLRQLPVMSVTTSLRRSLAIMQKSEAHLALVTDSKKRTVGVVMLEDILEELVGEIHDDSIQSAVK